MLGINFNVTDVREITEYYKQCQGMLLHVDVIESTNFNVLRHWLQCYECKYITQYIINNIQLCFLYVDVIEMNIYYGTRVWLKLFSTVMQY